MSTENTPPASGPSAASGLPWRAMLAAVAVIAAGGLGFALTRDDAAEPATKATTTTSASPAAAAASTTPAPGAPAVPAGPGGKVEAKETTFNAGSVDRGTKVTHAFELRNVGEHDLTVDAKPG